MDANEDPDYARLLTDLPLSFADYGIEVETPDLARFLTAQSGVEMLECLRRSFFRDEDVPLKWEFGVAPPNIFNAEERPEMSLTKLRIRIIESCSPFKVVGPVYYLEKK